MFRSLLRMRLLTVAIPHSSCHRFRPPEQSLRSRESKPCHPYWHDTRWAFPAPSSSQTTYHLVQRTPRIKLTSEVLCDHRAPHPQRALSRRGQRHVHCRWNWKMRPLLLVTPSSYYLLFSPTSFGAARSVHAVVLADAKRAARTATSQYKTSVSLSQSAIETAMRPPPPTKERRKDLITRPIEVVSVDPNRRNGYSTNGQCGRYSQSKQRCGQASRRQSGNQKHE